VWQRRALALARRLPRDRLHPAALARAKDGGWGVAISGGPDSLALLLLLWGHWPERRSALVALHFDHALRGAASRRDAQFCAKVCGSLGVRLRRGRWRRPESVKPSEDSARQARLAFFGNQSARLKIASLWLGHQQDDIAETFFMRMARGSGTGGLAAPRPFTEVKRHQSGALQVLRDRPQVEAPVRLRPLLTLPKRRIEALLGELHIPFCRDESNRGDQFLRNRIRSHVIPAWLKASGERDALAGAALSRELLQEDDEALEAIADSLKALTGTGRLNLDRLRHAPVAIWRRALHRWLIAQKARGLKFTLSRSGFTSLLGAAMMAQPTRISLGKNAFAVIVKGKLFVKAPGTAGLRRR
jgi:tRNA(Ile)-lysidine synthase